MTNNELLYSQVLHGKELAKQARIELYGLHYKTDFMYLFLRDMALNAISHSLQNIDFAYSEEDLSCMSARLAYISQIIGTNTSGSNSCC